MAVRGLKKKMFFTTKVQYDLQLWFITIGDKKKKNEKRCPREER